MNLAKTHPTKQLMPEQVPPLDRARATARICFILKYIKIFFYF
jgi:hypothetical protein